MAPCAGDRSTACEPHEPALPLTRWMPSLVTVSKIVPTMWNELSMLGPASRRKIRTRLPVSTLSGASLYWLATPLKTTKSGAGARGRRLVEVRDVALRAEVPLALDEGELLVDLRQSVLRLDDDHPVHAVGDVMEGRRRAAVVHPDAGVFGRPLVEQFLAGCDRPHLVVRSDLAGVEVDRVGHLAGGWVLEMDPHLVADLDPDDRTRDGPAERPDLLDEAGRDGHLLLGHHQVDVVDVARQELGRRRVVGDRGRSVRVRGDVARRQSDRRGYPGSAPGAAPATVTAPFIPACS